MDRNDLDLEPMSGEELSLEEILSEFRDGAEPSLSDLPEENPAPAAEEAPAAPAAEEERAEESPAPKASSWTFGEKKSALPSEAEVRAFMKAYARGEADEKKKVPGAVAIDERFHVEEDHPDRREMNYGGRRLDLSAEEGYEPHAASEYISSYTPESGEDEDEEQPDEAPSFGFLNKVRKLVNDQRAAYREKELARREAAAKKPDFTGTKELVLPGEEPEAPAPAQAAPAEEAIDEPAAAASQPEAPDEDADVRVARPRRRERPAPQPAPDAETTQVFASVSSRPEADPELAPSWSKATASHRGYAAVFPDTSASPAVYAEESDYDFDAEEEADSGEGEDEAEALKNADFFPSSFKEYLFSMLTSVLYRLRGGRTVTMTMDDDGEDLGPEAPPAFASKYYGGYIRSLRLRLRIGAVLMVILAWISLSLPVTGKLNDTAVASLFCLGLQLTIMLLSLDVVTGGILNAVRGKPGADTMAVISCFVTSVDAVFSAAKGFSATHMPLCLLSSFSLMGVLLASLASCRGLRKSLRVPAIAKRSYAVSAENDTKGGGITILKSVRPLKGFVRRTEEAAPDETVFRKLSIPILLLALLLALITSLAKRNVRDLFYTLSVILCPAVPFTALLSFALPYFFGSMRLFSSGAAVAGWSGTCDIGQSKNLIVTDRDLFPEGSVEIENVRIFADADPRRIISYAGSMLTACGSSVSSSFGDLMERNGCSMRQIENFEYLPGGGMKGVIDSRVILCGSSDLMQLMNVRIPFRLVTRTSVLLAVDGVLYGIFNVKYTPQPQVREALIALMRSGRHPVFAIRDFNVTPAMLHECFSVATDGYDFPPYVERFAMSEGAPGPDSQIAAVVCRDGLGPLSDTADVGRSMYLATRFNMLITVLGSLIGMLTAFFKIIRNGGVGIPFLAFFMVLWAVPVFVSSILLRVER